AHFSLSESGPEKDHRRPPPVDTRHGAANLSFTPPGPRNGAVRAVMTSAADTTQLLHAARAGDREAFDHLYSRLYGELRAIARQRLRRNPQGETLNTAALVHEAYLKLVDQTRV